MEGARGDRERRNGTRKNQRAGAGGSGGGRACGPYRRWRGWGEAGGKTTRAQGRRTRTNRGGVGTWSERVGAREEEGQTTRGV